MNHQAVNQLTTMIHVPTICSVQNNNWPLHPTCCQTSFSVPVSLQVGDREQQDGDPDLLGLAKAAILSDSLFLYPQDLHIPSAVPVSLPIPLGPLSSQLNAIAKAVIHRRHEHTDNKHGKNMLHLTFVHTTA